MTEDSSRTHRRDDFSRPASDFFPKTNPNASPRRSQDAELSARRQAEFPDRANPDYGRTPLTDDQKELATRYLPLARTLAHRLYARTRVERDEIESIAFMALVEAARAFDPSIGTRFTTFLRYKVVGAIIDFARKAGKSRYLQSSAIRDAWGNPMQAEHCGVPIGFTPDLPVGAEVDAVDTVEFHLRPMSPSQAKTCRLIYLEGKTQEEVAAIMSCSASYVARIHREAMELLFNRLRNRGDRPKLRSISPSEATDCPPQDARCRPSPLRGRTRMPKIRPMAMAAAC